MEKYIDTCYELIKKLNKSTDSQIIYVVEESSELIKELCKLKRNKGDINLIVEECADVITSIILLLITLDIDLEQIIDYGIYKNNRAIKRYVDKKEL